MRHLSAVSIAMVVSLAACTPRWQARFEQRSVMVDTRPIVGQAVVLYAADVGIMRAISSAQELGTVELDGTRMSPAQVNYFAARFAAKQGATHIVRVNHRNGVAYVGDTPVTVTRIGNTSFASGGQPMYTSTQSALFLAFKVPMEDWSQLPPTLVPQLGEGVPRPMSVPPPPIASTCATASEHLGDLANALVAANPEREPREELPTRERFVKLCTALPEEARVCLNVGYLHGHKEACSATFQAAPARDWLLLERLFLAPRTGAAPVAPPPPPMEPLE